MKVRSKDIYIGRVLYEDDDLMTIEVAKNMERQLHIEEGDRFLTILFAKNIGDGAMEVWTPWESDEDSAD